MGQRVEFGMDGILIILQDLAEVFDHFITMWAPGCAKITSPLARCCNGLKVAWEVGKRLEIRKIQ